MFYSLINDGKSDAIALYCYLKAVNEHPFFMRPLTASGKRQEASKTLSIQSGISQNTIKKHLAILVEYGLIRIADNHIACAGTEQTKLFAGKGKPLLGKKNKDTKKRKVFTVNVKGDFTFGMLKTIVKNSHSISKAVRSINSALLIKERAFKRKKAIGNSTIYGKKSAHEDLINYCGISNSYFSSVNGTKSISSGNRVKKCLESAGVISSKRRINVIGKFQKFADFLNFKEYYIGDKPVRYKNGLAYVDMPSEIVILKKNSTEKESIVETSSIKECTSEFKLRHDHYYGYMLKDETLSMCPDLFDFNMFNKSRFLYANRNNDENLFLTKSDIRKRFGWSSRRIKSFLGKPDKFALSSNNIYYGLFKLSTVVSIELSSEFESSIIKTYGRLSASYLKRISNSGYRF